MKTHYHPDEHLFREFLKHVNEYVVEWFSGYINWSCNTRSKQTDTYPYYITEGAD